ncbi:Carboxylic ester hydrolase [Mycena venus]|uniref:Carboxylic ester hydrolase n=1 Tax=Mycena venus TaxID=2733690 RepID=A0A8H7DB00_9AGAR|nr:Carboxylic ester hydrolase [Mycena venus]
MVALTSLRNFLRAALILLVCSHIVDAGPVVDLDYAKYEGVVDTKLNITAFRGIRYAAPPIGSLRFQKPAPPSTVAEIQQAFDDPPQCYQGTLGASPTNPFTVRDVEQSEDCLFLNVFSPALNSTAPLPTIVWIHGGGYGIGSASQYNGADLVQDSNNEIVAVVIQYRLGLFGFLAGQQVKDNGALNAGLLDQDLALHWVNKNIHKFGGDPDKVTLWGQSAGAGSILQHIVAHNGETSPQLFRAAIASSTFLPSQYQYNDRIPQTLFNEVAAQAGCKGTAVLQCLRAVDSAILADINVNVMLAGFQNTFSFSPVVDGSFITQSPTDALLQGKVNRAVKLLFVTNTNEGTTFVNQSAQYDVAEYVRNLFPLFGVEESNAAAALYGSLGSALDQVNEILGDSIIKCPSYSFLNAFPGSYKAEYAIPPALHGQDVINYFPSLTAFNSTLIYNNTAFINAFSQAFVSFAVNLNPNEKLRPSIAPSWPQWSDTAETEMIFNKTEFGAPQITLATTSSVLLQRCEFWKSNRMIMISIRRTFGPNSESAVVAAAMDVDMDPYNFTSPHASHEQLLELSGVEAAAPFNWPSVLLKECLDVDGLPETVTKLVNTPGVEGLLADIHCSKHILVRDEYLWALQDSQATCYRRKTKFQTPPECIHPKVQFSLRSVSGVPSPSPPVLSHNPFDDLVEKKDFYGKLKAFVILGHPGIGKTALLPIILVLRCLARRVTFLQMKPDEMWMFYPFLRTAYRLRTNDIMPNELRMLLPRDTWALIDSNEQISSVPPCITSMRSFVIQTTSPKAFRTDWIAKRGYGVVWWYMASWTLPELICGRDFDPLDEDARPTSEKDLEAFVAVCPPSARLADLLQDEHFDFEKHASHKLGIKISAMTLQSIIRLLSDDPEFDKDDTISHHVLAVTPGPMRHIPATYIPSREIYHLLRDKLRALKAWEAASFYFLLLRNRFTKGSAGYLLEDIIHILLGEGGTWQLTELQKGTQGSANTYWETGTTAAVLAIGHDGPLSCCISKTTPPSTTCVPIYTRAYNPLTTTSLVTAFYHPLSGSQPTFDAFFYDATTKTATIFQSTVSAEHSVKPKGIEWLRSCGAENFVYVALTPADVDIRFPFPNGLIDERHIKRYQLGLAEDQVVAYGK